MPRRYQVAARSFDEYRDAVAFAVVRANKLGEKQILMHKPDGLPWYLLEYVSPGSGRIVDLKNAAL